MAVWVGNLLYYCSLMSLQMFASLRLLGRPFSWQQLSSFVVLQAAAFTVCTRAFSGLNLSFILLSLTHFLCFVWVFKAPLFPDALFTYVTPLALNALGEMIFPPLFFTYFPELMAKPMAQEILGPHASRASYLPTILLALFYLLRKETAKQKKDNDTSRAAVCLGWFVMFATTAVFCYGRHPFLDAVVYSATMFRSLFLRAYLIALPVIGLSLYQYACHNQRTRRLIQAHQRRSAVQESALRTLREERHDLVNELALISTYVEMGRAEEALQCIAYSAAKLSDRYNYATLPTDAWCAVLELKKVEAERRQIQFTIKVETDPPHTFTEQRLLPKVIMNLLDNSFAAVEQAKEQKVEVSWSKSPNGKRVLAVSNNGPEIDPWEGKMMFRAGVTSKKDGSKNHGWGLVICKHIAEELGGTITYTSSPEKTTFFLTLPAIIMDEQRPLTAN